MASSTRLVGFPRALRGALAPRVRRGGRFLTLLGALVVPAALGAQSASRAASELAYGEAPGLGKLHPHSWISSTNGPTDRVMSMIYEPLFRFDFNAEEWENVLAVGVTSIAPTKGKSAFAIDLKPGVKWHDGTDFQALDVIRTFDYLRTMAPNRRRRELYSQLFADVRRGSSRSQVIFEFARVITNDPREYLLDFIIPASRVPTPGVVLSDSLDLGERPIGTGPYRFDRMISGYPVLVANERYHGDRASIPRVRARMFSDNTTLIETLLTTNGDISLAVEVAPEDLPRIEANKSYSIDQVETYNVFAIAIRARPGSPLAQERVRRALTMAVNREQILDNWFGKRGQVLASPIGPRAQYYDPEVKAIAFDSATARKELAAAGLTGTKLTFVFPASEMAMDTRTANVVRSVRDMLTAIGLSVTERPLARGAYQRALYEQGDFDLAFMRWEFNPSYDVTPLFHSNERRPGGDNVMNFSDPVVDRLLNDYRAETDPNRQRNIMSDLQRALRDKAPAIYLVNSETTYAYSNRLRLPPGRVDPFYFFTYANYWRMVR